MSSAAITRTGKLKYDQKASDLYARNPCPQVKFLPKKHQFKDESGNHYHSVFDNKRLREWAESSPLLDMIAGELGKGDALFFVRQNPERKKEGEEFLLADEGSLLLQSTADDELSIGQIVAVGDHTTSSYTARSVVWMLVRGLHS